ncbi:iron-containing alcohol dehydrogenase [Herbiconiux moechotypicola]|uniref:Iron-containing alcohol dehydrogenase n=1 Tax=Herbiconiux moechotypicola TaxID=637393 RepID=A0ABN3DE73_9MICO|nr:iron-containing alcohol dehydrogenase [Herbiconiux moechotypicola]MCS5729242.1 iron-containing alcohol dehydrogenase [Herbiconiux moechotypicola]
MSITTPAGAPASAAATASATAAPSTPATASVARLGILRQPKTVLFGPGQRHQLPHLVSAIAEHLLVTTDARMATTPEFLEVVEGIRAAGVEVSIYAEAEPDLPREDVVAVVERFGHTEIDAILGIGGGSCMDLAKVVSIVLANGGDVRDYYGEFLVPAPGVPVITVPTTGGTGAEVTCISVVFDKEKGMKIGVASPFLEAHTAVIDPELTLSCPPGLTAATGADALSHLVESFTDRVKTPTPDEIASKLYIGKNPLTDIYCRNGLALLGQSLEVLATSPRDLEARSAVMLAAYNAGMAINTAGTAAAHAIQGAIGNLTHTPHGFGISALLPSVMRFNLPERVAEFAEIGRLLGAVTPDGRDATGGRDAAGGSGSAGGAGGAGGPGSTGAAVGLDAPLSQIEQAHAGITRVEEILAALGAPLDLETLGLSRDDFGFVADQALLATRLTANNPRELTREAVLTILEHAYTADRTWWSE